MQDDERREDCSDCNFSLREQTSLDFTQRTEHLKHLSIGKIERKRLVKGD